MWEMRRPGCLVDNPRVTSKHRDARLGIRVPLCDTRETGETERWLSVWGGRLGNGSPVSQWCPRRKRVAAVPADLYSTQQSIPTLTHTHLKGYVVYT